MHHYDYQFNNGIGAEKRRFKRRLRLALLFVLITALTAGIIYFIIPKESKQQNTDSDQQKEAAATAVTAEQPSAGNNSSETPADNKNNSTVDTVVSGESAESEKVVQAGAEDTKAEQTPTAEPQKGKPWIGDPANDLPLAVENKTSSAVALEALTALWNSRSYNSVAEKAVEIMSSESEGSPVYRTAAEYLRKARQEQIASGKEIPGVSVTYSVRSGDTLSRIARRNDTTVAGIMSGNQLKNGLIRIGGKLIITPGPWKVEVSKSNRLLKLYQGKESRLFAVCPVGIGRANSTPVGSFVISTRLKDPKWYAPDGRVFEPGEDGNELGKYFLKLAAAGSPDRPLLGYGIHGTPDENTVGNSVSSGCIRMYSADIEMLYNLLPERTPVVITD